MDVTRRTSIYKKRAAVKESVKEIDIVNEQK